MFANVRSTCGMCAPKESMKIFLQEARQQSRIAIPTTLGLLLNRIPWIISLHFVGLLGPEQLAAAALATTLCNITGMSFSVGLSSAITTLTGQARGDILRKGKQTIKGTKECEENGNESNDEELIESSPLLRTKSKQHLSLSFNGSQPSSGEYNTRTDCSFESAADLAPLQPLVFLFRGIAIQLAFVIPIGLWWIKGLKPFLVALGQGEELSSMTETYLRVLTPGLWAYSLNWTLASWLQSIEIADVPAFAAFVGFASHIPFNILFVNVLGFEYLGVAMATVMFQLLQPIIVCGYLFGTARGRERVLKGIGANHIGRTHLSFWPEARSAVSSISGIKQYLSLALPGIVIISEWWASECIVFLSGRLAPDPDIAIAATSIYQTINTFFFMFPVGFSAASSARVGLFLGMNRPESAKMASRVSVVFAGFISATMGCILMFTPHELFPSIFTNDRDVLRMAASTIPYLAFYVFADGIQVALNGVIKGCGRQAIVAPMVIFAYWIVGVPMAYYNSFEKYDGTTVCNAGDITCGVRGLVAAMTAGTWVHFLLCFWVVAFFIRWEEEARLAHERMSRSENSI